MGRRVKSENSKKGGTVLMGTVNRRLVRVRVDL